MPISLVTWNINSVRLRVALVEEFLRNHAPDVLCLQEIKCVDEAFPTEAFEALGYNCAVFGQKGFNGVAILSKYPVDIAHKNLPNFPDELSRYIEVVVEIPHTQLLRVGNLYAPNGNPLGSEKFPYKLAWLEALAQHAQATLAFEEPFILLGDYNIIPHEIDAKQPELWAGDALFQPQSRAVYQRLLNLGFTDALRACADESGLYTFWDYQAGAWSRNNGIRIDHALLSPQAADALHSVRIHKDERAREKPSDHVPVEVVLNLQPR